MYSFNTFQGSLWWALLKNNETFLKVKSSRMPSTSRFGSSSKMLKLHGATQFISSTVLLNLFSSFFDMLDLTVKIRSAFDVLTLTSRSVLKRDFRARLHSDKNIFYARRVLQESLRPCSSNYFSASTLVHSLMFSRQERLNYDLAMHLLHEWLNCGAGCGSMRNTIASSRVQEKSGSSVSSSLPPSKPFR